MVLQSIQEKALSPYSKVILEKFNKLKAYANDKNAWEEYLYVFPKTKSVFIKIFDPEDFSELYNDSDNYIRILKAAPKNYLESILKIFFKITKNGAPGCCDAWSSLHMLMVELATDFPVEFSNLIKKYPSTEQKNIIAFMADMEAIAYSEEYEKIIVKLQEIKEGKLVSCFEEARKKRAAKRHD